MRRISSPSDRQPAPTGGQITGLTPQRRDAERVNVAIDGEFSFGLGLDIVLRESLAVGDLLDTARVAALIAADERGKATTAGLSLLAHRSRSEREIRDRLKLKGFSPGAIDEAVNRLDGWGYLNDASFARAWVENRATHQPRGERLLAHELRQKGIASDVIAETLVEADIDEAAAALELGRAKLRSYRGLEGQVARRRLAGFLTRRGFGYDVVGPVLDQLLTADADDLDEGSGEGTEG